MSGGPAFECGPSIQRITSKAIPLVAVGTTLSDSPPQRSQRVELQQCAPTLGAWRQSARLDEDV